MGALPQIFYSDRTKDDDFINEVKAYLCLNTDVAGYDSPFKKVAFTLTLIKGESAAQWVRDMGDWLDGLVLPRDNVTGQLAGGQENRWGGGMSAFDPQDW